ncbi:LLM class F420-dependent oxidoreductase [Nocardioides sp. SOB77]|uniref:LLM class F420-dependent oxidoreductase n=1 Tax=Nocardioides oceani TaxID=3058369 RepID=A0ABT8FC04_9ACTN|nr:LLM class F420-dependent oxidoreductase [Nocardioides oceani]MDN4172191.1 LLM class F420-dependent oxidoreductase [Nocardioides oceani]
MEPASTPDLRYAVIAPTAAGTTADPAWMSAFARHVEDCGFESVVAVEHAVVMSRYSSVYPYDASGRMELADDCPIPDPLELLAFLAGQTSRLGLATGVLVLPNHHPLVLAKRLATLDALSGGRLRVCVGMGWMREEVEACGTDFETRGRRADEQLQVMRALWAGTDPAGVDHRGEFFSFSGAMSWPKPAQPGGVPLHVGGHSRAAARRAGRHGDGLQPLGVAGEELAALVALMREEAERAGRDPDRLELSLGHLVTRIDLDRAARLAAQGASRVVLATSPTSDLEQAKDELSACAERLGLR